MTLTTVDSGMAATFSQHCPSSVHNKISKETDLKYVKLVREILDVDTMVDMSWLSCIVIE